MSSLLGPGNMNIGNLRVHLPKTLAAHYTKPMVSFFLHGDLPQIFKIVLCFQNCLLAIGCRRLIKWMQCIQRIHRCLIIAYKFWHAITSKQIKPQYWINYYQRTLQTIRRKVQSSMKIAAHIRVKIRMNPARHTIWMSAATRQS